jgi:hypothetical protein
LTKQILFCLVDICNLNLLPFIKLGIILTQRLKNGELHLDGMESKKVLEIIRKENIPEGIRTIKIWRFKIEQTEILEHDWLAVDTVKFQKLISTKDLPL